MRRSARPGSEGWSSGVALVVPIRSDDGKTVVLGAAWAPELPAAESTVIDIDGVKIGGDDNAVIADQVECRSLAPAPEPTLSDSFSSYNSASSSSAIFASFSASFSTNLVLMGVVKSCAFINWPAARWTASVTLRVSASGCLLIVSTTAGPPENSLLSCRTHAALSPRLTCGPSITRAN